MELKHSDVSAFTVQLFPINRTIMELKQLMKVLPFWAQGSINRTIMELKLYSSLDASLLKGTINRTIMELKQAYDPLLDLGKSLLIEPLWN